ncbi:hypothetical protein BJ122_102279 [Rhodopseudomonas faecalis]|uniref:Uncharacterized protein n=1 Tax=Rhodopseudomonas faecalis TaxID=99655 RepID=A0A318TKV6_9BRAD|nr:hypothetical protein [Rhodopseudomonas faecalis]PYF05053.1 hypothetical protein BJ122_102279 [Rhodopseudomonas faecalis]
MFTNWKTTVAGIGAILLGAGHIATNVANGTFTGNELFADFGAIVAGVGLLFGKDWNVTGGKAS